MALIDRHGHQAAIHAAPNADAMLEAAICTGLRKRHHDATVICFLPNQKI